MWLVMAHVEMIPRLEAEESMLEVTRTAVGTGSLKKGEGNRIMRQWRAASKGKVKSRPQPMDEGKFGSMLGAIGIQFVKEDRNG